MKRKLFVIPLIIALLVACMIPTFAAGETTNNGVAVTNGAGAPGSEVHLKISTRSAMADYVGLIITYDKEKLTLAETSDWLVEGTLSDVMVNDGAAVWSSDKTKEIKGDIFELVFKINETAEINDTCNVTCNLLMKRNDIVELDQTADATVTVKNLATISGTVTAYGSEEDPVTVELVNSDVEVVDTKTLENGTSEYEFEVEAGVYTICVKKTKHCPREYEVDMANLEDTVQDAEIRLYGDVNKDGDIDAFDAMEILNYFNDKESVIGDDVYMQKVSDVNKDGDIDAFDAMEILNYFNDKGSVFDQLD